MGPFSSNLSILIYHRVVASPDPLLPGLVCAQDFDLQLAALCRWFTVMPLSEAIDRLRSDTLPARTACVTFDDGYADNATIAMPILRSHGISATFFIASGFLDGGRMWNDTVIESIRRTSKKVLDAESLGSKVLPLETYAHRQTAIEALLRCFKYLPLEERERRTNELSVMCGCKLPQDLMMTVSQVRDLYRHGMEIGGHTASHPILATLEIEEARKEVAEGKRSLEAIIDAPIGLFAYPNGRPGQDYTTEQVQLVKDLGFVAAVSTAWGVANHASDFFQLPRFTPWDRAPSRFMLRLMRNTFRVAAPAN